MKAFIAANILPALVAAATCPPSTGTTSLKAEAQKKNILIGSGAINPNYLNDNLFSAVLSEQFDSLSPENELKWVFLNQSEGIYDWAGIDRLVDFAEQHDMVVKGHGLISRCCNPEYVVNMTDPAALRGAMTAHFEAVMHRYRGKMDRWDVVSEPLETLGGGIQVDNVFYKVLGAGYIEEAFRIARAADPNAKLFLNENLVESYPEKRQELYDLVSGLVANDVPLDGIALQMHLVEAASPPGVLNEMVDFFSALGLEVSIAEMDVHSLNDTLVTEIYGVIMEEGVPGAKPLLFDEEYNAKGAFYATHGALVDFVNGA
ncbi:glycoside hydrolase superfamily [Plectosphaerella cucumerina]|uniref:endo-1,4-beta-xylanase n=1 Tax=Plectosphaerella cucumerina TaxID=40658 RepID=A0A8K0TKG0_9PEZI|nr:glycoside hydrolase superfamily [Plectosphaerella cucumerina]